MKLKSFIRKKLNYIRIKNVKKYRKNVGRFEVKLIKRYLNELEGKNFLDFGCGFGEECAQAFENNMKVTGYDIEIYPEMKEVLKIYPDIEVIIDKLNLINPNKYHIVHSHHVLEHCTNDLDILIFLRKAINSEGILLLSVPTITNLITLINRFFTGGNKFSDKTHLREYTREEIIWKLTKAGFKVEVFFTSGCGLPIRGWGLISRIVDPNRYIEKLIPDIFFLRDSLNFICSPNEIIKTKNN